MRVRLIGVLEDACVMSHFLYRRIYIRVPVCIFLFRRKSTNGRTIASREWVGQENVRYTCDYFRKIETRKNS